MRQGMFFMTVDEAVLIANALESMQSGTDTKINKKLHQLICFRMEKSKKQQIFDEYLDEMGFKTNDSKEDEYMKNIACCDAGWNWMRITGPSDIIEINRSEIFTYECSYFAVSYAIYNAYTYNHYNIEESLSLTGKEIFEELSELYYFIDILEFVETIFPEENDDVYEMLEYLTYGAYYIHCKLSGKKMDIKYKQAISCLCEKIEMNNISFSEYYDSFMEPMQQENGFTDEAGVIILPYLLDIMFSFRGYEGNTPCLYVYSSKTMKAYSDIEKQEVWHPYKNVMEKLLRFLENPVCVENHESVEVNNMPQMQEEFSVLLQKYAEDSFVGGYYCFNQNIFYSPYFMIMRECFDKILQKCLCLLNEK